MEQSASELQMMLTMVQNAVEALNALTTTVQDALLNIYDPNGTN
jgi:hypothetical protein